MATIEDGTPTPLPKYTADTFKSALPRPNRKGEYAGRDVDALVAQLVQTLNDVSGQYNELLGKSHRGGALPEEEARRIAEETRQLYEDAQVTAHQHLQRAYERAERVEADAQAQAEQTVAQAQQAAETTVQTAQAEAEDVRATAERETTAQRETAERETTELRERVGRETTELRETTERDAAALRAAAQADVDEATALATSLRDEAHETYSRLVLFHEDQLTRVREYADGVTGSVKPDGLDDADEAEKPSRKR